MQVHTRRALLAGAATLAAGTVAATTLLRKPATPPIAILVQAPAPHLVGPEALRPVTPPQPPAAANFLTAEGEKHSVADFAGKGLLINLWATWCIPCVAEMPALQAAAKALAEDGILVLPLSSDRGGAAIVKKFYDAHDITALPIWLDPKGEAARAWAARGLPTTLVIDRAGNERARLEGGADWSSPEMLAAIRKLVG
jgi:thiol-disulfide isomerase/thioredoxin